MMTPAQLPCLQHFMKPQAALGSRFPAPRKADPDGFYFLSLIGAWSPKGRTGCGTSTHLQRTTAGTSLVRAVKADKRDHNSCLVAAGRLQRAVTVSFITAGFTNPISTAVSISKRNTKHWHSHELVLVWSRGVYPDSVHIV